MIHYLTGATGDYADGTFLAYGGPKNLPRLLVWLDQLRLGLRYVSEAMS